MTRRVLSSQSLKMEISRGRRRAKRGSLCSPSVPVVTLREMPSPVLTGDVGSDEARGRRGGGGRTGQVILDTSFTNWPSDGVRTKTAFSGDGGYVGRLFAHGIKRWRFGTVWDRTSGRLAKVSLARGLGLETGVSL